MAHNEGALRYTDEYRLLNNEDFSSFAPSSTGTSSLASRTSPATVVKQELHEDHDMSSGQQRKFPSMVSNVRSEKEKKKRSRVTPEQLVELEQFFAMDRNPPIARRKEISEQLGMQERQTQIWFQNRRAKAKLQDGKNSSRSREITEGSPEIQPPEPPSVLEVDINSLIHEDELVKIIPCSDLTIGSWRRIATSSGNQDLIAYVSDVKRCLNWFIRSGGYGFKMEIPFDSVENAELTNAGRDSSLAVFVLSRPPNFYLENVTSAPCEGFLRTWKRCSDWTEGHQATHVLRHTLIGSSVQLAHVLEIFHSNTHTPLRPLSYRPGSLPPLEIPALGDTNHPASSNGVVNPH
ncbi:hypothetical protein CPB84DRAFT_625557 [Gymnopilus junonius]|uniref:Homeobox domain-containing protein n=1 Tax=Gymnopilus junonius TaxID=109634 RepID=A0A9P5NUV6_GYMJU|nr:hypothetical protein CPB84DRAFT_625557 [Gymnopilus junonius]